MIIKYSLIYTSSINWVMMFFGWLLLSWIWLDFVSRSQGIEDEWARGVTDEETYQNFLRYQNKTDTFLCIATNRLKGSNFVITILPWCPDFSTSQCLHSPQPWRRWHFSTFNIARFCKFAANFQTPIKVLFYNKMHWLEKISLSPAQMLHISSL